MSSFPSETKKKSTCMFLMTVGKQKPGGSVAQFFTGNQACAIKYGL